MRHRLQLPVLSRHENPPDSGRPERPDESPQALIDWAVRRFDQRRLVMTTQFGMEGCALIDMLSRTGEPSTVVYLDTHFLFPETYTLRDRLALRYPTVRFENRGTTMTPREQEARHGPELWRTNPDLCCRIRKIDPMRRVLEGVDAWITGIRRDQSASRAATRLVEWDWRFDVLKISPLADWSRGDVWDYIKAHDVPFNPLHEREYPTVGCTHCTAPVPGAGPESYSRAGRWNGSDKVECGLHGLANAAPPAKESVHA